MVYNDFHSMKDSSLREWQKECVACTNALSPYKNAATWHDIPKDIVVRTIQAAYAYVTIRSFLENIRSFPVKRAVYLLLVYLKEALDKSGFNSSAEKVDKHIDDTPAVNATKYHGKNKPQTNIDFDRPKHLSEYEYMLPDELKSETLALPELYLRLADLRQQIEILVAQQEKNDASNIEDASMTIHNSLAQLAKDCIATEQQIRSLWNLVDKAVEYYDNNKRPPSMSEIQPEFVPKNNFVPDFALNNKRPTEFTKEEIDKITDPAQQEYFKRKRIIGNKSYLNRVDIVVSEEYKKNLKLRHKELVEWGVRITPRMQINLNRALGNEE